MSEFLLGVSESGSDTEGSSQEETLRYRDQPAKDKGGFGNSHCRWTILYAFIVLTLSTVPLWLSAVIPETIAYVNAVVLGGFSFVWLWIAFNAARNFGKMLRVPLPGPVAVSLTRDRKFRHIVIVPCYIDPPEVLFDCLGSLLMQPDLSKLVVVVAFEKKTPNVEAKMDTVRRAFEGRFGDLLLTVHTIDFEKEIPGGCSNKNSALRKAYRHIKAQHPDLQEVCYTVTTCDTDSLFYPQYFDALEAAYNGENPRAITGDAPVSMCVWQPPVFYNWDLDQRPFFVRTTGIVRSLMMLGGLISFNLNPMSIFSYPLELGLEAGFINPRYSVDDIIFKTRCMCDTNQKVPVRLLPVPVVSGPTIGTTFLEEISEWERQIRRWIIGSSESFHYFLIHYRGQPFLCGLWWFCMFFMYYAVLLCCAGVFGLFAAVPYPWATYPDVGVCGFVISTKFAGLGMLIFQYVAFAVAFVIDFRAVRLMTIQESIGPLRNLTHWLLSPFVLIVYSLIAYYAVLKFVYAGKRDAGHVMAAKAGLGSKTADESATSETGEQLNVLERKVSSASLARRLTARRQTHTLVHAFSQGPDRTYSALGKSGPEDVVARLPQAFWFGSFAFDPEQAPRVKGRKTYLYE